MPNNNLIVFLSPKTINKKFFLLNEKPVRWIYLGKKFHEKIQLENALGTSFHCLDIARIHNDVADTIRQEFVGWIDTLNRLNGSSIDWWFGPISSRNVYRSDMFQYCCYMEILDTIWKDPTRQPAFIVVESPALANIIQKWGNERKISVTILGKLTKIMNRTNRLGIFFLRWANFIFSMSLRTCAAMMLTYKSYTAGNVDEPLVIIHTYIHPESISETGVFSDRYFPHLYEFLDKHGKKIAVLPTYHGFRYNYFTLFFRINRSNTKFIIPEQYLKISDLFHAFGHPIYQIFKKYRAPSFRSIDYSESIKEDSLNDKFEDSLEAILFYRLTERLKNDGIHPERCIDWYENQAKSRALVAGFKKFFPTVPVIGAQIFLHYPNFLSLSPTISEIEASIVPDRLLETSPYQCKQAKMFVPALNCKPCAALRYAHLFEKREDLVSDTQTPVKKNTILLLASFDMEETLELLTQIHSILEKLSSDVCIQIKFHPDMDSETIVRQYGADKWSERISIFSGNISEAFYHTSLVISKSSGSIVEAAAQGIPVIFLGNQTKLNFNPLSGIYLPSISECYTTEELEISIKKYLAFSLEDKDRCRKYGEHLRDLFFTEINDTTMSPFLQ
jgi:hypothetical protein